MCGLPDEKTIVSKVPIEDNDMVFARVNPWDYSEAVHNLERGILPRAAINMKTSVEQRLTAETDERRFQDAAAAYDGSSARQLPRNINRQQRRTKELRETLPQTAMNASSSARPHNDTDELEAMLAAPFSPCIDDRHRSAVSAAMPPNVPLPLHVTPGSCATLPADYSSEIKEVISKYEARFASQQKTMLKMSDLIERMSNQLDAAKANASVILPSDREEARESQSSKVRVQCIKQL